MKLVTFAAEQQTTRLGLLIDGAVVDIQAAGSALDLPVPGSMIELIEGGETLLSAVREIARAEGVADRFGRPAAEVTLLAPVPAPRKNIFCVGRNYRAHIIEGARARGIEPSIPKVPEFFTKPPTSVIGDGAEIRVPEHLRRNLDYEVELAVVIGKRVRDLTQENAMSAVFGYTIVNDVSARDLQKAHGQWFKGKGLDTTCPIGPCITDAEAFGDSPRCRLTLRVNGEVRQDSTTEEMLFSIPELLVALSAGMTLEPGDIVATGTPAGVALGMCPQKWLVPGDVVEAEIEGIGVLTNPVAG